MRGCEHLVSSQVLQKTIDELRAITRIDLCVLSLEGQKVASTFSEEGFEPEYVREFVKSPADSQVLQAYHFFKIYGTSSSTAASFGVTSVLLLILAPSL